MELQMLLTRVALRLVRNQKMFILVCAIVSVISTLVLYFAEGFSGNFQDGIDFFSWITGTLTTTGFTAMPKTPAGRLIDAALKVPLFLMSLSLMGTLVAWIHNESTKTARGRSTYHGKGHTIVVGWNEVARSNNYRGLGRVVLIDSELDEIPERVEFYVRGHPSDDETLLRAGCQRATRAVVVCGFDEKSDGRTGLVCASLRRLNPNISITAVAMGVENVDRLEETGATVICPVRDVATGIIKSVKGKTIVFGSGPVVDYLKIILTATFSESDPAVDHNLELVGIGNFVSVVIVPHDDDHAWLAVSSVRRLNPSAGILCQMVKLENSVHLRPYSAGVFTTSVVDLAYQ